VARIHLPALRERKSDIPLLIRHFIQHFNRELGRSIERVGETALRDLLRYDWPGNIRELRNTVEGLFVNLPTGNETQLELPERMCRQIAGTAGLTPNEQERLISTLWATDWNKSKAARKLQWSRMTLYRKMAKYGLDRGGQAVSHGMAAGG
jgi:DNA-binding NtrC family response regulator